MGLTTNPNDPALILGQNSKGQNDTYLVLSEEERSQGFVRPVRDSYVHKGRKLGLDIELYNDPLEPQYVGTVWYMYKEDGSRLGGMRITQKQLDELQSTGGYLGGCGALTRMGQAIAETYARNPHFYGATYCIGCKTHLPVGEFVWDKTDETVGS